MKGFTTLVRIAPALALIVVTVGACSAFAETACPSDPEIWIWTIWGGQSTDAGTVTLDDDATNLYVTYSLTQPGTTLGMVRIWAGNERLDVAGNREGGVSPARWSYSTDDDTSYIRGGSTYTFAIPLRSLGVEDIATVCPLRLYLITHAEVVADPDRVVPDTRDRGNWDLAPAPLDAEATVPLTPSTRGLS